MGLARFNNGAFRLIASVRHNADDARLDEWKASFQRASQMLFDATIGQHHFGEILVANNSMGAAEADCWLMEFDGGSGSSHHYGQLGEHSTLMADERFRPFIILHEFSHYAYDVFDEYAGSGGSADCIGGNTANACIMESSWLDGDRFGNNGAGGALIEGRVKHFCVPENHDPDGDTRQDQRRNQSCWESMVGRFPTLTMPASAPLTQSPGNVPQIVWTILAPEQRYLLVVDRSGSMAGNKLMNAKDGCHWWVDNALLGDRMACVSFSDSASIDQSLVALATDTDRTPFHTSIDSWIAQGQTAIGDGLRGALDEIIAFGPRAAAQVIVLLTDGIQNRGEAIESVLPDIINAGVRVYAIAVGPIIDEIRLTNLAVSTGGRFIRIDPSLSDSDQSSAVRVALEELSIEVRDNGGIITSNEYSAEKGTTINKTIEIEPHSQQATFLLSYRNPKDQLKFRLKDPAGVIYDMDTVRPGVRVINGSYPYNAFKILKPKAGKWKIEIRASAKNSKKSKCNLIVGSENTQLSVACNASKSSFEHHEEVHVYVRAFAPIPITGLKVDGLLSGPRKKSWKLSFKDDGKKGDEVASDGVYTASFIAPDKPGTYHVRVSIRTTNTSPILADHDDPGTKAHSKRLLKVPTFNRLVETSFVVGKPPRK